MSDEEEGPYAMVMERFLDNGVEDNGSVVDAESCSLVSETLRFSS